MKWISVAVLVFASAATCQTHAQAPVELQVRADESYRTGEFKEAARLYRTLVEQDSSNEKAHKGLVSSLLKNDDVEEALLAGAKAIEALPPSASIHAVVGDVCFRAGDMGEAERHYRKSLELDSNHARGS